MICSSTLSPIMPRKYRRKRQNKHSQCFNAEDCGVSHQKWDTLHGPHQGPPALPSETSFPHLGRYGVESVELQIMSFQVSI